MKSHKIIIPGHNCLILCIGALLILSSSAWAASPAGAISSRNLLSTCPAGFHFHIDSNGHCASPTTQCDPCQSGTYSAFIATSCFNPCISCGHDQIGNGVTGATSAAAACILASDANFTTQVITPGSQESSYKHQPSCFPADATVLSYTQNRTIQVRDIYILLHNIHVTWPF